MLLLLFVEAHAVMPENTDFCYQARKDVGGEAGLEERGFVGRYRGGRRLGRSSHRN